MIEEIKIYKELLKSEQEKADEICEDSGHFLVNEIGKPIEPRTYQDLFYKLIKS